MDVEVVDSTNDAREGREWEMYRTRVAAGSLCELVRDGAAATVDRTAALVGRSAEWLSDAVVLVVYVAAELLGRLWAAVGYDRLTRPGGDAAESPVAAGAAPGMVVDGVVVSVRIARDEE